MLKDINDVLVKKKKWKSAADKRFVWRSWWVFLCFIKKRISGFQSLMYIKWQI